jgi:hypothetical protein
MVACLSVFGMICLLAPVPQLAAHALGGALLPRQTVQASSAVGTRIGGEALDGPSVAPSDRSEACNVIITNSTINSTLSRLYAGHNGSWTAEPSVATEVSGMFLTVCDTPTFQSLVTTWGSLNASLGFEFSSSGPQVVNFSISWEAWDSGTLYANLESWQGNIPNGTVTGPFLSRSDDLPVYGPPTPQEAIPESTALLAVVGAVMGCGAIGALLVSRSRQNPRGTLDMELAGDAPTDAPGTDAQGAARQSLGDEADAESTSESALEEIF